MDVSRPAAHCGMRLLSIEPHTYARAIHAAGTAAVGGACLVTMVDDDSTPVWEVPPHGLCHRLQVPGHTNSVMIGNMM